MSYTAEYKDLLERRKDPRAIEAILKLIDPWIVLRVKRFARKRTVSDADIEDMLSEARIAVFAKAIPKFDPTKSAFTTYATFWIDQGLRRWYETHVAAVRVPIGVQQTLSNRLATTDPATHESAFLHAAQYNGHMRSFDMPMVGETDGDGQLSLLDLLADPSDPVDEQVDFDKRQKHLRGILETLPTRTKAILRRRLEHDHTLEEIAQDYGLCRERVRQIEKDAIAQIRHLLSIRLHESPAQHEDVPDLRQQSAALCVSFPSRCTRANDGIECGRMG